MAHTLTLNVTSRAVRGSRKLHALRRQGLLPGIVYGYKVADGMLVQVDRRTFEQVYRRAGANSLIDLRLDTSRAATKVFVHEIQRHPVNHALLHVDFRAVNLDEPITAEVALILVGEAPAVREVDGMVMQVLENLHVRALPAHIPSNIEVDVSGLSEVGQGISVGDLQLPADVEVLTDPELHVVHIIASQRVTEEEEAATEAAEAEADEAAAEGEDEG